jgi:hypothetical protein
MTADEVSRENLQVEAVTSSRETLTLTEIDILGEHVEQAARPVRKRPMTRDASYQAHRENLPTRAAKAAEERRCFSKEWDAFNGFLLHRLKVMAA